MRLIFKLIALLQVIFLFLPIKVYGADYFINDTFHDTTMIDVANTTAEVDTTNGWVTLGLKNLANSLILYEDNYDITLINNDAVETYYYNGTNMQLDFRRSINGGLTEPISISGRSGEYLVLDRGTKVACWYHYDGSGMVENGSLSVSSLNDPRALDIMIDNYDFVLLDDDWVRWYGYDGTGFAPLIPLNFHIGESNPISVSLEDNNYSTAVLDKANKSVLFYNFNGSSLVLNPVKSIQTPGELTNPRCLTISEDGGFYLIVDDDQIKAYNYDGSSMVYNPLLSVGGLNKPLAIAIKPGCLEYAVLLHDGSDIPQVSCFGFNGTNMEEISNLKITGLDPITYANDQVLQGNVVDAGHDVSGLKLQADVDIPPGTSITWEVTVDGTNWEPITVGDTVRCDTSGTKPNYRAILHTDDNIVTPKILSVQLLDASLSVGNFRVIDIVGPVIPDNPVLPTDQQVNIWAGYNVSFEIVTTGGADSVVADISVDGEVITLSSGLGDLTPSDPVDSYINTWTGTFHTNALVSIGTLLDIDFTVRKGTDFVFAFYPDFAVIYGSALDLHKIHLTH